MRHRSIAAAFVAAALTASVFARAGQQSPEEFKAAVVKAFSERTPVKEIDPAGQDQKLVALYQQVLAVQSGQDDAKDKYEKMLRSVARSLEIKEAAKVDAIVKLYLEKPPVRVIAANSDELAGREAIIRELAERNAANLKVTKQRTAATMKTIQNFRQATDNLAVGNAGNGGFVFGGNRSKIVKVVADRPDELALPRTQALVGFTPNSPAPTSPDPNAPKPGYWDRIKSAYGTATAYVSEKIADAKAYVTEKGRAIVNRFYRGVELIAGYGYDFFFPGRKRNFGTEELTTNIATVAAYMKSNGIAQTDLMIGDISSANGGKIGGHLSHRRGVDADIGYYMLDAKTGKPHQAKSMVTFNQNLRGWDGSTQVVFDSKRNWELVKAFIANPDPKFRPTHIFIATHLEKAVLGEAKSEDEALRKRAAGLMSYWPNHANHLHLRIE